MSRPAFHAGLAGHHVVAASQASHGGVINFNYGVGPPAAIAPAGPFSTVLFQQDPDFVERPAITAWLHDRLSRPPHRAALVGLGGIGKSQLAIRYAHDVRSSSPDTYVFWVHAGTAQRFEDAYRTIAERLGLPGCRDPETDILRLVRDWLCDERNGRWLMVLDNADDVRVFYAKHSDDREPIAAFLPQSNNGLILVTSRSRDAAERLTGSHNNVWAVPAMEETQALQLLRHKLGAEYDGSVATDLIRDLECLPLAITQAAAYVVRRAPRMSPSTYLTKIRHDRKKKAGLLGKDMGDMRRDAGAYHSIIATWQLTFEGIRQERPSAADLLAFMSFFSPQGIPDWILRSYAGEEDDTSSDGGCARGDEDGDSSSDDDAFEDDLDVLRGYSLVAATLDKGILEMHPLVQFCTQEWLSSTDRALPAKRMFFRVMSKEYPVGTYENWATCRALDVHIGHFEEGEPEDEGVAEDMAVVLASAGYYRWMIGSYKVAEEMLRKAVRLREKVLGPKNLDTLTSVSNLGSVLQDQGKYEEAEEMHRRTLEGWEKALGAERPSTLASVNNLGTVLQYQGKHGEAEEMHRRALEGYEKTLGVEHPNTLTSVNNLGKVLRAQGKYDDAERMHRRALEGREKALGAEHPSTVTSVNNLGLVLRAQGKYEGAEEMHWRALEGSEKALGAEHPDTLRNVSDLGSVLQDQGKYKEAEEIYRRALEGWEKALGPEHPWTLTSVNNLGSVLRAQGKYEEAEGMHRRMLEGYEKALGLERPSTLASVNNLGLVLQDQGKYEEAEEMHRRALEGYEKTLGPENPWTLSSVNILGSVLRAQGKYEEAERMHRQALKGWEKALVLRLVSDNWLHRDHY
ncbi:TPR domain protein [Ilyonectria destructans]|nr:TPR domain protein [Ilyonectria destructans]